MQRSSLHWCVQKYDQTTVKKKKDKGNKDDNLGRDEKKRVAKKNGRGEEM
jgi:hypothetical protein